jgi:hypothetical protein
MKPRTSACHAGVTKSRSVNAASVKRANTAERLPDTGSNNAAEPKPLM